MDGAQALAAAIDEDRLWSFLMRLAEIGALENGGVNRQALTELDSEAKNLVSDWAVAQGFPVFQDEAANLFIRLEGQDANSDPILVGSHLDSQPTGGKFDGAFGVAAGLEILAVGRQLGLQPKRPVEAVAWMNEEGSRFLPGATGSSAFAGTRDLDKMAQSVTVDGTRVADDIAASIAATRASLRPMAELSAAAYLEAHIEQGPILEREGYRVGIVQGIQGIRRIILEISGETAHAGTTPHSVRKDALVAATRIMAALHPLTESSEDILRLTFGRIEVFPNSPNTVPDKVHLTVDLRHPQHNVIEEVTARVRSVCEAERGPCTATVETLSDVDPVEFDETVIALLGDAATKVGIASRPITSGAGHDALHLAKVCPTGMVFVPCKDGISHHESESATPSDLAIGTQVLAATAWELANR